MCKWTGHSLEELGFSPSNQGFEEPWGVTYRLLLWVMISCFSYAARWIEKWLREFLSSRVSNSTARCYCRNVPPRPIYDEIFIYYIVISQGGSKSSNPMHREGYCRYTDYFLIRKVYGSTLGRIICKFSGSWLLRPITGFVSSNNPWIFLPNPYLLIINFNSPTHLHDMISSVETTKHIRFNSSNIAAEGSAPLLHVRNVQNFKSGHEDRLIWVTFSWVFSVHPYKHFNIRLNNLKHWRCQYINKK
jgi:hypothetical protein